MTDLNAGIRQSPANPPPAGPRDARAARRARADRAAAVAGSARRWPLSRIISVALLILLLFSVAAMVAGGLALLSLHDNRERAVVFIAVAVGLAAIGGLPAAGRPRRVDSPLHRRPAAAREGP